MLIPTLQRGKKMAFDLKLIWLFCIGVFLSFLFYVSEVITQNELIGKLGLAKVVALVIINSIIGGVVMVTAFYFLEQFASDWNEYLKVGISGFLAMLGKDAVHLYHKVIKTKTGA